MHSSLFAAFGVFGLSLSTTAPTPVIYEDLADLDVFRVDDTFYYSASTMHYSPGAPILSSKDLINWEFIGHSVPVLDFGSEYYLQDNSSAYIKGIYASSLRQRPSDGQWFWVGCIEYSRSYVYTAPNVTGPWTQLTEFSDTCFYDCGLLFDDDMTPYIASQSTQITVSQLSNDLTSVVKEQQVYDYQHSCEGSRFYKINGAYYILNDDPETSIEYVMQSDNVWGPYTSAVLANGPSCPSEVGGSAHQGGIVDDGLGNWYYMAFCDAYPLGRSPVIAPITFGSDGFPTVSADGTAWPTNINIPLTEYPTASLAYLDQFQGTSLSAQWEWNHNPVTTAFSVNNGLTLNTATVTNDFYMAQNTLTHRVLGPSSRATIELDYSSMHSGDRAGLAMLRDQSSWIGILNDNGGASVGVWSQLNLTDGSNGWTTANQGSLETSTSVPSQGTIYLRASGDFTSNGNHSVSFSYSTDGNTFNDLGSKLTMDTAWEFYMGYRFAIFNFATSSLGGSVQVKSFNLELN